MKGMMVDNQACSIPNNAKTLWRIHGSKLIAFLDALNPLHQLKQYSNNFPKNHQDYLVIEGSNEKTGLEIYLETCNQVRYSFDEFVLNDLNETMESVKIERFIGKLYIDFKTIKKIAKAFYSKNKTGLICIAIAPHEIANNKAKGKKKKEVVATEYEIIVFDEPKQLVIKLPPTVTSFTEPEKPFVDIFPGNTKSIKLETPQVLDKLSYCRSICPPDCGVLGSIYFEPNKKGNQFTVKATDGSRLVLKALKPENVHEFDTPFLLDATYLRHAIYAAKRTGSTQMQITVQDKVKETNKTKKPNERSIAISTIGSPYMSFQFQEDVGKYPNVSKLLSTIPNKGKKPSIKFILDRQVLYSQLMALYPLVNDLTNVIKFSFDCEAKSLTLDVKARHGAYNSSLSHNSDIEFAAIPNGVNSIHFNANINYLIGVVKDLSRYKHITLEATLLTEPNKAEITPLEIWFIKPSYPTKEDRDDRYIVMPIQVKD